MTLPIWDTRASVATVDAVARAREPGERAADKESCPNFSSACRWAALTLGAPLALRRAEVIVDEVHAPA